MGTPGILPDLPESASQDLEDKHKEETTNSLNKHIADKIRAEQPFLKDAPDMAVLRVAKRVHMPNSTPEDFMKVAKRLYAQDWSPPSKSLVSQGVAMAKDFGAGVVNDLTGIPKGLVEGAEGLTNLGMGQLQRAKNVAFGTPQEPSEQEQTGTKQLEASGTHLSRGGAFAVGVIAASMGGEALEAFPAIEKLAGKGLFGKAASRSIEGAVGFGSFGAASSATKEYAKSTDIGKAFQAGVEGAKEGAIAGAVAGPALGAVGDVTKGAGKYLTKDRLAQDWYSGLGVERKENGTYLNADGSIHYPFTAAEKIGRDTVNAKTPEKAKETMVKFSAMWRPEMEDVQIKTGESPEDYVKRVLVKNYGEDVVNSPLGESSIKRMAGRVNPFSKPAEPAIPELEPQEPQTSSERIERKIMNDPMEGETQEELVKRAKGTVDEKINQANPLLVMNPDYPEKSSIPEVMLNKTEVPVTKIDITGKVIEGPALKETDSFSKPSRDQIIKNTSGIPEDQLEQNIKDAQNAPDPQIKSGAVWIGASKDIEPSNLSKEQRAQLKRERKKIEREAVEKTIDDYLNAVHNGPRINGTNFKILDTTKRPLEIVQDIAESPIYEALSGTFQDIHDALVQKLVKYNRKYLNSKFWGIDISNATHEAVNIPGSYEASNKNLIVVHPFNIWGSVQKLLLEGKITNSWEGINDAIAGQSVGAILHEITHNIHREEGPNFAYELTHNISRLINDFPELKKLLLDGMDENNNELAKLIYNDYKRIKGSVAERTSDASASTTNPTRENPTRGNQGSIRPSEETRNRPTKTLPTSVEDQAPRFAHDTNVEPTNDPSSRENQLDPIHQEAAKQLLNSPEYIESLRSMGGGRTISHAETIQKALQSPAMTVDELSNWPVGKAVNEVDVVRASILRKHLWDTYRLALENDYASGAETTKNLFIKTEAGFHNLTATSGRATEIQKVFTSADNIISRTKELWDSDIPPSQLAARINEMLTEEEEKAGKKTPEKKSMLRSVENYSIAAKLSSVHIPVSKFMTDSFAYWFRGMSKTLSAGMLKRGGHDAEAMASLKFAWGASRGFKNGFEAFKRVYMDDIPKGTVLEGDVTELKSSLSVNVTKKFRPLNPFRLLQAITQAWYSVSFHSEMSTKAYAQALTEGLTDHVKIQNRYDFLMEHPLDGWKDEAEKVAKELTGQQDSDKLLKAIQGMQKLPGMRFVMPVVKFPYNLTRFGLKISPLGILNKSVQEDFMAGGMKRADVVGRFLTGSLLTYTGLSLVNTYPIYGAYPSNVKERQYWKDNNIQPWSLRIGTKFVKFDRLQPLGTFLQQIAAIKTAMSEDKYDEASTITQKLVYQYSHGGLDLPFLGALQDLGEAITDPKANLESFLRLIATGFVPSVLRDIRDQMDPVVRKPKTLKEALENMIPGLLQNVPADITASGEKRKLVSNPLLRVSKQVFDATPQTPTMKLKADLAYEPPDPKEMLSFLGNKVKLEGAQKERYFTEMNKAADEALSQAVDFFQRPELQGASNEQKKRILKRVVEGSQSPIRMKYKALLGLGGPEIQAQMEAQP